jgi:hypothetical protein
MKKKIIARLVWKEYDDEEDFEQFSYRVYMRLIDLSKNGTCLDHHIDLQKGIAYIFEKKTDGK